MQTLKVGIEKTMSAELSFFYGEYFLKKQEYKKAEKTFKKTLEFLSLETHRSIYNLINYKIGVSLFKQEKYNIAKRFYSKIEQIDTNSIWLSFFSQVELYAAEKNFEKIPSILSKIPFKQDVFDDLSMLYFFFGKPFDFILSPSEFSNIQAILKYVQKNIAITHIQTKLILDVIHYKIASQNEDYKVAIISICDIVKEFSHEYHYNFIIEYLLWDFAHGLSNKEHPSNSVVESKIEMLTSIIKQNEFLRWKLYHNKNESLESNLNDIISGLYEIKKYQSLIDFADTIHYNFSSKLLFEVAYSYKQLGDADKALYHYSLYLNHYPLAGAALNNVGVIYEERKEFIHAIEYYEKALKTDDDEKLYKRNLDSANKKYQEGQRSLRQNKIPENWTEGLKKISVELLNEYDYFQTIDIIEKKVLKKFKPLILRDYNELVVNYLMNNNKAIVVLSGSFVELLLTYFLDKKRQKTLQFKSSNGNPKTKKLYDCNLIDLINYIQDKNYFPKDFHHLYVKVKT